MDDPSKKKEFNAKLTVSVSITPSTSKAVYKRKMPPKKTETVPKLPRLTRATILKTSVLNKKASTNCTTSSRKGKVTKPISYELSDEEDMMLNPVPHSSGDSKFNRNNPEVLLPPIPTLIDSDEDAVEPPPIFTYEKQEDLQTSHVLPTLNIESKASESSTFSKINDHIENVDAIINRFLESNETSFDRSRSNREYLTCVDEMLSNNSNMVQIQNSFHQCVHEGVTTRGSTVKCNPELSSSLIEVIDLSSSNHSISVVDISDVSEKSKEKPATSEQSAGFLKQSWGDCPICLEPIGSRVVAATVCGHIFCDPCIRNCIKATKKCPNCRKTLNQKQIHPLFI